MAPLLTPVRRVCGLVARRGRAARGVQGRRAGRRDAARRRFGHGHGAGHARCRRGAAAHRGTRRSRRRFRSTTCAPRAGRSRRGRTATGGGAAITLTHDFVGQADLARRLRISSGTDRRAARSARSRARAGGSASKDSDRGHRRPASPLDRHPFRRRAREAARGRGRRRERARRAAARRSSGRRSRSRSTVHAPGGQSKTVQLRAGGQATVAASTLADLHAPRSCCWRSARVLLAARACCSRPRHLRARSRRRRTS